VRLVLLVPQARKAPEVATGQQVLKVLQELQELQELKVLRVQQVQLDSMDKMAHRLTRHG
jgi:hypothetical protein